MLETHGLVTHIEPIIRSMLIKRMRTSPHAITQLRRRNQEIDHISVLSRYFSWPERSSGSSAQTKDSVGVPFFDIPATQRKMRLRHLLTVTAPSKEQI